jgi:hypothetical protein
MEDKQIPKILLKYNPADKEKILEYHRGDGRSNFLNLIRM